MQLQLCSSASCWQFLELTILEKVEPGSSLLQPIDQIV